MRAPLAIAGIVLFFGGASLLGTKCETIMHQIYVSTGWTNLWLLIITIILVGMSLKK